MTQLHIFAIYIEHVRNPTEKVNIQKKRQKNVVVNEKKEIDTSSREVPFIPDLRE